MGNVLGPMAQNGQQGSGIVLEEKTTSPIYSYLERRARSDQVCSAARNKNIESFRRLISLKHALSRKDAEGFSPIHYATFSQWPEGIQAVMEAQGDINARSTQGYSPLQIASYLGDVACVKILLEAGADLETPTVRNSTAVMLAAQQGASTKEALALLLQAGAQVSHRGYRNRTALQVAVLTHGRPEVIKMLTDAGADPSLGNPEINNNTPLHTAAHLQRYGAIRTLLDAGANANAINDLGLTPLMEVFLSDNVQGEGIKRCMVRDLARHGADLNAIVPDKGLTALHFAVVHSQQEFTAQCLIDLGVDVSNNIDVCPSHQKNTMLHLAAKRGWVKVLEALLNAGADTNARNKEGMAPLHLAVINKQPETISRLLQHGVDPYQPAPDIWPSYGSWKVRRGLRAMEMLMNGPIPLNGVEQMLASLNGELPMASAVDMACCVIQDMQTLEAFVAVGAKPSKAALDLGAECTPILRTIAEQPMWTPELHKTLPPSFKFRVREILLILKAASKRQRDPLPPLTPDALACILTKAAYPISTWTNGFLDRSWVARQMVKEPSAVRRPGDEPAQPGHPANIPPVMHIMPDVMEQVLHHIQQEVAQGVEAGAMMAHIPGPGGVPGGGGNVMINLGVPQGGGLGGLGGGPQQQAQQQGGNNPNNEQVAMVQFDFQLPFGAAGGGGGFGGNNNNQGGGGGGGGMPAFAEMLGNILGPPGMMLGLPLFPPGMMFNPFADSDDEEDPDDDDDEEDPMAGLPPVLQNAIMEEVMNHIQNAGGHGNNNGGGGANNVPPVPWQPNPFAAADDDNGNDDGEGSDSDMPDLEDDDDDDGGAGPSHQPVRRGRRGGGANQQQQQQQHAATAGTRRSGRRGQATAAIEAPSEQLEEPAPKRRRTATTTATTASQQQQQATRGSRRRRTSVEEEQQQEEEGNNGGRYRTRGGSRKPDGSNANKRSRRN